MMGYVTLCILQAARAGQLSVLVQLLDYGANVPQSLLLSGLDQPAKDLLEKHLVMCVLYILCVF